MVEILSHTPVWVFVLGAVLFFFGLKQSKERQVPERMVIILPVAMLILSLLGVISGFGCKFRRIAGDCILVSRCRHCAVV